MTDLALLTRAFDPVPEPDDATVSEARAALLRVIAQAETGATSRGQRESHGRSVPLLRRPSPRVRIAIVAIVLLLVLAGIATATYVGIRAWISSGPRGIQYARGYGLATVFAPSARGFWSGLVLDPASRDLYGLRWRSQPGIPALVRVAGVDRGSRLTGTQVIDLRGLGGPGFQSSPSYAFAFLAPAGIRAAGGPYTVSQPVTIAPNGDVFLLAVGRDPADTTDARETEIALFVLRPDGTRQEVLTTRELISSGLLAAPGGVQLGVVATSRDRLWLKADTFSRYYPFEKPFTARGHFHRLFEVIDPNGDGDWQDRIVRGVDLPRAVSAAIGGFTAVQLAAEPPVAGDSRSRSVLVAASTAPPWWMSRATVYRVYRISDRDGDGDALDSGEARLVLERHVTPPRDRALNPVLSPRVVRTAGVAHRELIVAGLTRWDRVSVVSESGTTTDIARSFPGFVTVLTGPRGAIYLATEGSWFSRAPSLHVYRLEPSRGEAGQGTPVPRISAIPPPPLSPPAVGGVPQILFRTLHGKFVVAADGARLREPPRRVATCFSADGRRMAYRSDAEAPQEAFVYLADADGGRPRKVTEHVGEPVCTFSARWLLLDAGAALVRHDLRTGRETLIRGVGHFFALSPDGTRLVYANPAGELMLLDLATLDRRRLAAPSSGSTVWGWQWSPDGKRVAYLTSPPQPVGPGKPQRNELWVRNVADGSVVSRTTVVGVEPSFTWSPDSAYLAICFKLRGGGLPSCAGATARHGPYFNPPERLLLVTLSERSERIVAHGQLVFAGFAPSGELAYATWNALFVRTPDGQTRKLASAPDGRWPFGEWLGWSPDGRYIGLSGWGPRLTTVEVDSGRTRIVYPREIYAASWWHR